MNHMWKDGEFGPSCWRCGYTPIAKEANEPCSGAYDEKRRSDLTQIIQRAQASMDLLAAAADGKLGNLVEPK